MVLPPFAYVLTPGFHAAIFFLVVFFRITHGRLSKRGTTHSLENVTPKYIFLYTQKNLALRLAIR